jgi:hypothetical protein
MSRSTWARPHATSRPPGITSGRSTSAARSARSARPRNAGDYWPNSTTQELRGSGWLAAEPEATPQIPRLRHWGFAAVSPSHPIILPHRGIRRITVGFSKDSRFSFGGCLPRDRPSGSLMGMDFELVGKLSGVDPDLSSLCKRRQNCFIENPSQRVDPGQEPPPTPPSQGREKLPSPLAKGGYRGVPIGFSTEHVRTIGYFVLTLYLLTSGTSP